MEPDSSDISEPSKPFRFVPEYETILKSSSSMARCGVNKCFCPYGRKHNDPTSSIWSLVTCLTCNQNQAHLDCIGSRISRKPARLRKWRAQKWRCQKCMRSPPQRRNGFVKILNQHEKSDGINTIEESCSEVSGSGEAFVKNQMGKRTVNSKLLKYGKRRKTRFIDVPEDDEECMPYGGMFMIVSQPLSQSSHNRPVKVVDLSPLPRKQEPPIVIEIES